MRKVPTTHSNSPSPAPPSVSGSAVGQPPKGPSTAPRAPSRLATQTDAYPQRGKSFDSKLHLMACMQRSDKTAAGSRRASSSTTVNQTRGSRAPSRNETPRAETKEPQWEGYGRPSMNRREQPSAPPHKSPTLEEEEALSSSSSEESDMEDESANKKPARFKRFGRFSTTQRPGLRDDEEDEDDSPAFLPLSREQEQQPREKSPGQDLSATLRLDPGRRRTSEQQQGRRKQANESSTSSASSGVPVHLPESEERRPSHVPHGLSPRRAAELAGVSPRRSTASGKSASDDTPSMGSSFSDLDGRFLILFSGYADIYRCKCHAVSAGRGVDE